MLLVLATLACVCLGAVFREFNTAENFPAGIIPTGGAWCACSGRLGGSSVESILVLGYYGFGAFECQESGCNNVSTTYFPVAPSFGPNLRCNVQFTDVDGDGIGDLVNLVDGLVQVFFGDGSQYVQDNARFMDPFVNVIGTTAFAATTTANGERLAILQSVVSPYIQVRATNAASGGKIAEALIDYFGKDTDITRGEGMSFGDFQGTGREDLISLDYLTTARYHEQHSNSSFVDVTGSMFGNTPPPSYPASSRFSLNLAKHAGLWWMIYYGEDTNGDYLVTLMKQASPGGAFEKSTDAVPYPTGGMAGGVVMGDILSDGDSFGFVFSTNRANGKGAYGLDGTVFQRDYFASLAPFTIGYSGASIGVFLVDIFGNGRKAIYLPGNNPRILANGCFSNNHYIASNQSCVPCPLGMLPMANLTSCEVACGQNEIHNDTQCVACPAGMTPNAEYSECLCPPDEVMNGTSCESCPAGNIPDSQQATCKPCPPGLVVSSDGTSCIPCSISQITVDGACVECPSQQFPDANATSCYACAANEVGFDHSCVRCGPSRVPNDAHDRCDPCEPSSVPNDEGSACAPCPDGLEPGEFLIDCVLPDNTITLSSSSTGSSDSDSSSSSASSISSIL